MKKKSGGLVECKWHKDVLAKEGRIKRIMSRVIELIKGIEHEMVKVNTITWQFMHAQNKSQEQGMKNRPDKMQL